MAATPKRRYAPSVVIPVIAGPFFERRGFRGIGREGRDTAPAVLDADRIVHSMTQTGLVRLDAINTRYAGYGHPDRLSTASEHKPATDERDQVVVLVLSESHAAMTSLAALRALLTTVRQDRTATRLGEIIIIAEEAFFVKHSRDSSDLAPLAAATESLPPVRLVAYPYYNFICVIPDHVAVSPHRIMSEEEVAELLAREYLTPASLPLIHSYDPPLVWLGARPGQIIQVDANSRMAGTGIQYRRVIP
jgi:DNA-directed RNA polymerase subunit H (RpoH/RPB5)